MSGKPADAPDKPEARSDRRTRVAQGPAPVPERNADPLASPTAYSSVKKQIKRGPRSTVLGTPDVLAEAASPPPPPPPMGKLRSGQHKAIDPDEGGAPTDARARQHTVLGAGPRPRRPTGEYGADDDPTLIPPEPKPAAVTPPRDTMPPTDAAPTAPRATPTGTIVPGAVVLDPAAPGRTVVPGAFSVDDAPTTPVARRPGATVPAGGLDDGRAARAARPTAALAGADTLASVSTRPKTQPLTADDDDAETASRPTVPRALANTDLDPRDRRRGTHFHGAQGLVDAGNESPKLRLVPGRVIPATRYKILRWLGEGGMGVVYEAAHVDIERRSALKILRFDLSQQPKMVQVFRDEARAASRLGSPHIVEIYDFGELPDGRLFFAMELLDGHDLVPTEDAPYLPPGRLIGILRQVCKGLAAAHDAGVVHRDVKPENIIVSDKPERRDVAKIVDFGISSMLAAGDADGGGIAGTPHYMAPEQILGNRFDGRLDVYALGATAYELLVGQPPFDGDDVEDILQQQCTVAPPAPRTVRPDLEIPAELETVILKCLAKSPEQRFATMAELEAALCEAQIAAGLTTDWDDLAVPEIADADRRARIVAKMPSKAAAGRRRSLFWPIVAGASTLAAAGLGAFLLLGGPTDEELTIVEQLTAEAKEAAADQSWVVPTATRPDDSTAYQKVLELEAIEGPAERAADQRGEELRARFSTSLVGTADKMWDQGYVLAARQFYLYALTFDETNEHAFERLNMTPVMFSKFRDELATGDFGAEQRLMAGLAGLAAEENPEKKKLLEQDIEQRVDEVPDDVSLMIAQAVAEPKLAERVRTRPKRGAAAATPAPKPVAVEEVLVDPPAEEAAPAGDDVLIEEPVAAPEPERPRARARPKPRPKQQDAGSLLGKAKRDPERAADLAAQGMAALKSGQRSKASSLFNQAIAFDRNNAKALMGLSDVFFDTGANRKAVNYAEKAVGASPNSGAYRIKLGDAYFKVLRYQDAKAQYEKAKELGASRADQRLKKVAARLGG